MLGNGLSSYTFTDGSFVRKGSISAVSRPIVVIIYLFIYVFVAAATLYHAFFLFLGAAKKEKKALGKKEKEAESAPLERPPAGGFSDSTCLKLKFTLGTFS